MNPNTVGKLVDNLRTNGPSKVRYNGRTYKATLWSTLERGGPTWPQIEAARDCPCPSCQRYGRKDTP